MTRCIIVDDEPQAREVLKSHIASVSSLELVGEFPHAVAAFDFLQCHRADLAFLDIQMPQLLGTDFVKSLSNPPRIIFTTAFRDYALDGFELGAVDYLLKPVSFDRFLKAVYKVTAAVKHDHEAAEVSSERFLYFRVERKMVKVLLEDILFIESQKDYVRIVTSKGQLITKQSITAVAEMLPEESFVRIHRSFIVAMKRIDSFTTSDITIGKSEIPVGPLYRSDVIRRLGAAT